MNVEIVHHKMPALDERISLNCAYDMIEKVLFVPRTAIGRRVNLTTGDIKVDDKCLRAMPSVLELLALNSARSHWQRGMLAFQGLDTAQLIRTQHTFTLFDQFWRPMIHVIDVFSLLFELLVRNLCQPIANPVRLEIALFLKASPRVWARCRLQYLV